VQKLLDQGVAIDSRGHHPNFNKEVTALHCASRSGHGNIVELLLRRGADVNALDAECWTPLYYAANAGHSTIAKMLLDNGADKEIRDSFRKRSPLDVAKHRQFHDIVAMLGGDPADTSYHRTAAQIMAGLDANNHRKKRRRSGRASVMRGIHFGKKDLFLGRYRISEEDVQRIVRYKERRRDDPPDLRIPATDTVLGDACSVVLRFSHDRALHAAEEKSKEGAFLRSAAIETEDFLLVTRM